jgi:hypothetical protein
MPPNEEFAIVTLTAVAMLSCRKINAHAEGLVIDENTQLSIVAFKAFSAARKEAAAPVKFMFTVKSRNNNLPVVP